MHVMESQYLYLWLYPSNSYLYSDLKLFRHCHHDVQVLTSQPWLHHSSYALLMTGKLSHALDKLLL